MKRVAFSELSQCRGDSPADGGSVVATMPTDRPSTREKPVIMLGAHSPPISWERTVVEDPHDDHAGIVGRAVAVGQRRCLSASDPTLLLRSRFDDRRLMIGEALREALDGM